VLLAGLLIQTLFLNLFPIVTQPDRLRVVGTALYVLGLATAMLGRVHLGRNWANLEDYGVLAQQALVTHGIYRYIRHPIYIGDLLLLVGLELALNSWLVVLVLVPLVVIIRQARAEEQVLAQTFPTYRVYQAQTKQFIPFII
jgi:protein-S-isoprenylcysteine O-methyltransferase Ste14